MTKRSGPARASTVWSTLSRGLGLLASLLLCGAACMLLALVVQSEAAAQAPGTAAGYDEDLSGVRIIEASGARIVLEIDLTEYVTSHQSIGARTYDLLSIPGWDLTQSAGMPQLPVRRLLLGVPPDSEVHLEVRDATVQEAGPYRILPAPERVLVDDPFDPNGSWLTEPRFDTRYLESLTGYGSRAYQPAAVAQLGEVVWLRSQRIAAVDLYPILYSAGSGQIRFHPRFRVELSFSYAPGHVAALSEQEEPAGFEQLLQHELLNYEQAREWRSPSAVAAARVAPADWPLSSDTYRIVVTDSGLYQLTYAFLLQGGMPAESLATLDPQTFQLFSMGQEMAIRVVGEEDHSFDAEDYILFYDQGIENKYTDENLYWLTYGQSAGRRMELRNGEPSGTLPTPTTFQFQRRIEENQAYLAQWPGDDSVDRWYRQPLVILPEEPVSFTVEVSLDHVSTEPASSTLWVSMIGSAATEHKAEFFVNELPVGSHSWFGNSTAQWVGLDFSQAYLKKEGEGPNTVRANFPGVEGASWEAVYFDRYELAYQHNFQTDTDQLEFAQTAPGSYEFEVTGFSGAGVEVYDITEPLSVARIVSGVVDSIGVAYSVRFSDTVPTTRTYLTLTPDRWLEPVGMEQHAPANLRDPSNAADYIIISHRQFLEAAHQLAAFRAGQGLRTLVVDVQDIYDEFGFGLAVPHAIRDFVRYAYENWQASYLVLLGDGTYDPKNRLNQGAVSYLTPYLGFVDPWLGETATDNWFVAVSGGDILPDLHLGRLPANSLSEAQTMVGKIISYEQAIDATNWSERLTFVAGLQPDEQHNAGDFHTASDAILDEVVPTDFEISRIYLGSIPGSTCATGTECQQQLVQKIDGGTLLVNFIGHGSVIQWESIFYRSTIGALSNSNALPVMLPMTCLDGYFIQAQRPDLTYPDYPSLSELLVRTPGKGAVASWGPTGLGVAYGHDQLDRGFLEALLQTGIPELGPATYAGKLRLYSAGHSLEQIEEYTLFGDPALRVKSPVDLSVIKSAESSPHVVPGEIVTFTLSFANGGPGIAFDVTLTDLMPPELANPTVVYASPEVISQHVGITFSWTITDLWPHTGGEIQIRAVIDSAAERLSFFNTATISSSTPDLDLTNNRSQAGIGTEGVWLPLILGSH